jgi:hypothetical protein
MARRAAELARYNTFAAERVLERRLIEAADTGDDVPAELTSKILRAARPEPAPQPATIRRSWFAFTGFQWSAASLAFAATLAVAVFGWKAVTDQGPGMQRIQVAMIDIDDRRALAAPTRFRTLQNNQAQQAQADGGYRDVTIPADLLRRAIAGNDSAASAQLETYLPTSSKSDGRIRVLIDGLLANRVNGEWSGRTVLPLRIYDLEDKRSETIRNSLKNLAGNGSIVLLTMRP